MRGLLAEHNAPPHPGNVSIRWNAELDAAMLDCRRRRMPWHEVEVVMGIGKTTLRRRLVALEGPDTPLLTCVPGGRRKA